MTTAILLCGRAQKMKHEIVPMVDYFYEIALQDVEVVNLLASTISHSVRSIPRTAFQSGPERWPDEYQSEIRSGKCCRNCLRFTAEQEMERLTMQHYNLLNRSCGEIVTQKFKNLQQVEDFLRKNNRFELIEEYLQNLPVRGTRQISIAQ